MPQSNLETYTLSNGKQIEIVLDSGKLSSEAVNLLFYSSEEETRQLLNQSSKRFGIKKSEEAFYSFNQVFCAGYESKNYEIPKFRNWLVKTRSQGVSQKDLQTVDKEISDELNKESTYYLVEDLDYWYHICSLCLSAVDFNGENSDIKNFFEEIQNKMYWASFRLTPAEMIYERIDSEKPYLGLHRFLGETPEIYEVLQVRNYLSEEEGQKLAGLINFYWSISEKQLAKEGEMTKRDWISKLEGLLQMTGYLILINDGNVTPTEMEEYAKNEYGKFIESF